MNVFIHHGIWVCVHVFPSRKVIDTYKSCPIGIDKTDRHCKSMKRRMTGVKNCTHRSIGISRGCAIVYSRLFDAHDAQRYRLYALLHRVFSLWTSVTARLTKNMKKNNK